MEDALLLRTAIGGVTVDPVAPPRPRRAPARSGRTSCGPSRRTAWPRCRAPRSTSASPATRWAAAAAGWPARKGLSAEQRARRSSSSPPTAGCVRVDHDARARAVLGPARRRRQLRRRHAHRARAVRDHRGVRRHDVWPVERRPRGARRVGRLDAHRARRRHDRRCGCCASRRCPRSPSRLRDVPVVVVDGAVLADAPEAAAMLPASGSSARPIMDTWATMSPRRPAGHPHGPARAGARQRGHDAAARPRRRGPSTRCWRPSTPSGVAPLLFAELRQLGGALAPPRRVAARSTTCRVRTPSSRSLPHPRRSSPPPAWPLASGSSAPSPWGDRPPVPQLHRPRRTGRLVLRTGDLGAAARRPRRGRSAAALPRRPRGRVTPCGVSPASTSAEETTTTFSPYWASVHAWRVPSSYTTSTST